MIETNIENITKEEIIKRIEHEIEQIKVQSKIYVDEYSSTFSID